MPFLSMLIAVCLIAAGPLSADVGMWAYHGVPAEKIQKAYGFTPTQEWLDHVRLSSARINDGGSGSFVSANGLLLTNHHVALGAIQRISTPENDYVQNGFAAPTMAEEKPIKDMEINVLVAMENVTARVAAAVKPGASDDEANLQKKAEISRIEKESADATGLRSDVVTLYQGGEYWLYRYKKFTDVRLVMAPEFGAAFFGGDPDNFTYPRHDLDMTFLRVYENGKPYAPPHFLKWSETGAKENEPTFVSGHPGSTQRLKTLDQFKSVKESLPAVFENLKRQKDVLTAYASESEEQARQAKSTIFSIENALKVYKGRIDALNSPSLWQAKESEEKELRAAVEKSPVLKESYLKASGQIAEAAKKKSEAKPLAQLGGGRLAGMASTIVNMAVELAKPNAERWPEYRDSGLESLKLKLFSPAPIFPEMEKRLLALNLQLSVEKLASEHPYVREALQGKTPKEVAEEAVSKTKLMDPEFRKQLVAGGAAAVDASEDPLIRLAARLAPFYRETRSWYEKFIESLETAANTALAKIRFAVFGNTVYPDATFTLRLSYGKVAGYEEGTTFVPYKTTFYGLYNRAASFDNKPPFNLPAKLAAAKDKVKLDTPLNFVTTNDIIGGNSGSPVVNRSGELVGLIFDGNIQSLVADFMYDDVQSRALAVHSAGILEALTNIYGMNSLVQELVGSVTRG